jgi:hypothetical protein
VIDVWYLLSGNHSQTVVNIATVGVFAGMVLVWSAQYEYAWRHWLAGAVAVAGIAIGYWYFLLALGALAIAIAIVLHSPPDRRF